MCNSDNIETNVDQLYAIAVDSFFKNVLDKDVEFKTLTTKEEQELITQYKNNRSQLEYELTKHNIFFAVYYAKKYVKYYTDLDELISLAMFGLRESARRFNPSKGYRFNTFASFYIKKYVLEKFYTKHHNEIERRTAIYLDDVVNGDMNREDGYSHFNIESKTDPCYYAQLNRIHTDAVFKDIDDMKKRNLADNIVHFIATSSLSDTDKEIFHRCFVKFESIASISRKMNIDHRIVKKSKQKIMGLISENFNKNEIF